MSAVPPPPQPPPPAAGPPGSRPADSRNWAMAAHLSAFVVLLGVPLPFLGPLVIWLVRRDTDPYAAIHAREALNFQLTMVIVFTVGTIVTFVTAFILVGLLLIPVLIAAAVAWFVLVILAAIKAANGEHYRYPFTIRFVT
ncbi:MAG: DUF4870 domain-containing protein [Egibacteraceae bacterium]